MTKVYVKKTLPGEDYIDNLEMALKKFKKQVNKDGTLQILRAREYFEKPGVVKRKKKEAAIRAAKKKQKKYF